MPLLPPHQQVIERFTTACQADDRIVAAFLGGSHARGTADAFSDLDLYLITSDDAFAYFVAEREAFLWRLGEPLFAESFGSASTLFYVLADGTEGELGCAPASDFYDMHAGPYRVLVDKPGLLGGIVLALKAPDPAEQVEAVRRLIVWFWHDVSHFITAMGRGQYWWAYGQLEVLRRVCVNLARLHHDPADPDVGEEPYFKVEKALPAEALAPLEATLGPREPAAMRRAAQVIVDYYRTLAPPLADAHGLTYPAALERVTLARFALLDQP